MAKSVLIVAQGVCVIVDNDATRHLLKRQLGGLKKYHRQEHGRDKVLSAIATIGGGGELVECEKLRDKETSFRVLGYTASGKDAIGGLLALTALGSIIFGGGVYVTLSAIAAAVLFFGVPRFRSAT